MKTQEENLDCPFDFTSRCTLGRCDCKPKQETLEEAFERFMNTNFCGELTIGFVLGAMKFGAKWQQERSYSFDELRLWLIERDVYLYNYYTTYKKSGIPMENVDKYIEDSHEYLMGRKQFKKK